MNPYSKIRSGFLGFAGYLVLLIQSLPPLGIWTGLMTLPLAGYLVLIFTNLPVNLFMALSDFFMPVPFLIPERTFVMIGFLMLVYSVAYLRIKKKEGLITSGPYRLIRHPQYLGMIILTLGFTSWSVWILSNTFGIGFLDPYQTIGVWFIELFAYVLLAHIEELYMAKKYGETFEDYKNQVPFLIPFLKTRRKSLEILVSILIPATIIFILFNLGTMH